MKEIRAGLLGFGTIGTGVVKVIQQNSQLMTERLGARLVLTHVADLDITTDRGVILADGVLTTDAQQVISNPQIDIVIELIGGYEPARTFVLQAIKNGKHVVTANKALLAVHGEEIFAAAEKAGVEVMFEAAVGGGIPIISSIKENLCANNFFSIFGILNGTCNYILTRMTQEGADFSEVLADAQAQGYAEADPTFDIEGVDTAHKLALLIGLCFGTRVDFNSIYTEGIGRISPLDIYYAELFGYKLKLLAISKMDEGKIEARVHPTMVPLHYTLADVDGVFNAVRLQGDFVGPILQSGYGAGMEATASAIMGDVISISRGLLSGGGRSTPSMGYSTSSIKSLEIKPMDDLVTEYYLRVGVTDKPGVLASITGILGAHNISIASMVQPEQNSEGVVPLVFMTHEAREADIRQAIVEIDNLDVVQDETHFIRIESDMK
jgi:homoserine dehydrogenase